MARLTTAAGLLLVLLCCLWAPLGLERTAAAQGQPPPPAPGGAQTEPVQVEATIDSTIGIRQATQQQADTWSSDRAALAQRYRAAEASIAYLTERRRLAADRLGGLEGRVGELQRRLAESARLQTGLEDTLGVFFARLEAWVASDLPFLPAERHLRLDHLRQELARPEVPPSEKLRRLLEAFQIEAQYGGTAEVYQDRVLVGADSLFVDVLRLGRLSLFWRTPDGARAGEYDRAAGAWVDLPGKHHRAIGLAMEMAERRRTVDLVSLPLGRIRP
jgi:hypothetical protein